MPKNFQTSQYDEPICFDGWLDVDVETDEGRRTFRVEIERAHMEEDTGKTCHAGGATGRIHGADYSLVDYNRAGIPLIEIVTKPFAGTGEYAPEVARAYVDARCASCCARSACPTSSMEQGSLRCDVNLSLRRAPADPLGTRTETKNVNSLRSVERAVRYEITRQAAVLASGGTVVQETRHWHEDTGLTTSGRAKKPTPRTTATSPSPTWCRSRRPGSGSSSCAPRSRRHPAVRARAAAGSDWGLSDFDMASVVNAGALDLVEATVAAGAPPGGARKWWLGELARHRQRERRRAVASCRSPPAQVAEVESLVDVGLAQRQARPAGHRGRARR